MKAKAERLTELEHDYETLLSRYMNAATEKAQLIVLCRDLWKEVGAAHARLLKEKTR